jgi:hypothetical protein
MQPNLAPTVVITITVLIRSLLMVQNTGHSVVIVLHCAITRTYTMQLSLSMHTSIDTL